MNIVSPCSAIQDDGNVLLDVDNIGVMLKHPESDIEAAGGAGGRLVCGSSCVQWVPCSTGAGGGAAGFSIVYSSILLHAVATESDMFDRPCVYCQLEDGTEDGMRDDGGYGDEDDDEDGRGGAVSELRLFPVGDVEDGADILNAIWEALSKGAVLNPDESAMLDEEEEDDDLMYAGGDVADDP